MFRFKILNFATIRGAAAHLDPVQRRVEAYCYRSASPVPNQISGDATELTIKFLDLFLEFSIKLHFSIVLLVKILRFFIKFAFSIVFYLLKS